ncbi:hypothetical protein EmuJ_000276800 [Echinococcus multilocularis]|uniref:Uncharacterized protein n=1 Tax=Echinococcus multilocularis TaxID=6211 RepID=A0A068XSW2_ECHMU|nr:hypothetical protein EmuJ_000276800 [Echinococcus multilocularis]
MRTKLRFPALHLKTKESYGSTFKTGNSQPPVSFYCTKKCPTIMLAASAQDNSTGLNDFSVTLFEDTFFKIQGIQEYAYTYTIPLYGGMCSYKIEQITFSLKNLLFDLMSTYAI